jgi:5'-nucleotidase
MSKPKILITNDDGIFSKGIAALVEVASKFGDLLIIAPDKAQSGMGHAITINHPLRVYESHFFNAFKSYACSGTPVDCIKLGIFELSNQKPDLILSGINHGGNAASNILYSGTMSAAIEGAITGIPSVGFSYADYDENADFSLAQNVVNTLIPQLLNLDEKTNLKKGVCLNVNIPKVLTKDYRGIRVCAQAHSTWEDQFDKRKDQFNRDYYWLTGDFEQISSDQSSDLHYLSKGFTTIVPATFDMTAYETITQFKFLES